MEFKPDNVSSIEAEFMLKEYDRLSALKISEQQQVEQRINFFLSITTATVGAIVILFQISSVANEIKFATILGMLIIQLFFGIVVLNRLASRVVQIKMHNQLLGEIRSYFASYCPNISTYVEKYDDSFKIRYKKYKLRFLFHVVGRLRGSLVDLMLLANSLISGGIGLFRLLYEYCIIAIQKGNRVLAQVVLSYRLSLLSNTISHTESRRAL